jgi:hypothetical protein
MVFKASRRRGVKISTAFHPETGRSTLFTYVLFEVRGY